MAQSPAFEHPNAPLADDATPDEFGPADAIDVILAPGMPPLFIAEAPILDGIVALKTALRSTNVTAILEGGRSLVLGAVSADLIALLARAEDAYLITMRGEEMVSARVTGLNRTYLPQELSLELVRTLGRTLDAGDFVVEGIQRP